MNEPLRERKELHPTSMGGGCWRAEEHPLLTPVLRTLVSEVQEAVRPPRVACKDLWHFQNPRPGRAGETAEELTPAGSACLYRWQSLGWKVRRTRELLARGASFRGQQSPRPGWGSFSSARIKPCQEYVEGHFNQRSARTTLQEAGDLLSDTVWNFFCLFVLPGLRQFRASYFGHCDYTDRATPLVKLTARGCTDLCSGVCSAGLP